MRTEREIKEKLGDLVKRRRAETDWYMRLMLGSAMDTLAWVIGLEQPPLTDEEAESLAKEPVQARATE